MKQCNFKYVHSSSGIMTLILGLAFQLFIDKVSAVEYSGMINVYSMINPSGRHYSALDFSQARIIRSARIQYTDNGPTRIITLTPQGIDGVEIPPPPLRLDVSLPMQKGVLFLKTSIHKPDNHPKPDSQGDKKGKHSKTKKKPSKKDSEKKNKQKSKSDERSTPCQLMSSLSLSGSLFSNNGLQRTITITDQTRVSSTSHPSFNINFRYTGFSASDSMTLEGESSPTEFLDRMMQLQEQFSHHGVMSEGVATAFFHKSTIRDAVNAHQQQVDNGTFRDIIFGLCCRYQIRAVVYAAANSEYFTLAGFHITEYHPASGLGSEAGLPTPIPGDAYFIQFIPENQIGASASITNVAFVQETLATASDPTLFEMDESSGSGSLTGDSTSWSPQPTTVPHRPPSSLSSVSSTSSGSFHTSSLPAHIPSRAVKGSRLAVPQPGSGASPSNTAYSRLSHSHGNPARSSPHSFGQSPARQVRGYMGLDENTLNPPRPSSDYTYVTTDSYRQAQPSSSPRSIQAHPTTGNSAPADGAYIPMQRDPNQTALQRVQQQRSRGSASPGHQLSPQQPVQSSKPNAALMMQRGAYEAHQLPGQLPPIAMLERSRQQPNLAAIHEREWYDQVHREYLEKRAVMARFHQRRDESNQPPGQSRPVQAVAIEGNTGSQQSIEENIAVTSGATDENELNAIRTGLSGLELKPALNIPYDKDNGEGGSGFGFSMSMSPR